MSVEARYLNGDSVVLENCDTVGCVKVRIATMKKRFASDVVVTLPETGEVLVDFLAAAPSVVSVTLVLEEEGPHCMDLLRQNLRDHAAHEDVATCVRLLIRLFRCERGELDLDWVFFGDCVYGWRSKGHILFRPNDFYPPVSDVYIDERMTRTLLGLGLPYGKALRTAALGANKDTIISLLSAAANPTRSVTREDAPLHRTYRRENIQETSITPRSFTQSNIDEALYAASRWNRESNENGILEPLLNAGPSVEGIDGALNGAVCDKNTKAIYAVLAAGPSVAGINNALRQAALTNQPEEVNALTAAGASTDGIDSALVAVASVESRELSGYAVKLLLGAGPSVACVNEALETVLKNLPRPGFLDGKMYNAEKLLSEYEPPLSPTAKRQKRA